MVSASFPRWQCQLPCSDARSFPWTFGLWSTNWQCISEKIQTSDAFINQKLSILLVLLLQCTLLLMITLLMRLNPVKPSSEAH